ncbi:hypothetical protein C9374_004543 [Naegleria lovaniensis]|uniref:Galactose oxidase n=1 Tax=Naegleria lovaniensis TaxID=51637 RepID=A0AA88GLI6_NAELO|nr:uncharacterized protein C9374_004543 [Naegleria lovaniensis]KAG2383206.1 hypothetical protein C9374_004543 [Naegleria lovaniensis]
MKKLFKSSKNDVAACPHPTNMFFQYKFNTHEFKLFVAGEENTSSSNNNGNTISKKPSFLNSAANFWPTVHANHTVLAISKDLFIFGGNYLKWNDLTQDSSNSVSDATKKVSFVYVFDLKKKKFDQPKLPSFSIPKQASHDSSQASVSTSYSASSSTDSLGDGTMHPIHIPLPIEDVDTKQKERRSNLLDSIKLFGRERKGSIHDHRQLSTDIRDIAPPNRFGHSVINVNGIAYVYGGRLRKPYLSGHPDQVNPYSDESVYSYNFKSSQFTRLKIKSLEKPHPRMFHAMVEIPENNCFLMMGGHSANEKVLDDEGLSMMMEDSQSSTSSTTTPTLKYFSDCYLFDILRGEWTLVKQKGHLPLCAETECRSPVALARTKDGNFLCVVKNGQSGSLEVYEGKLSF